MWPVEGGEGLLLALRASRDVGSADALGSAKIRFSPSWHCIWHCLSLSYGASLGRADPESGPASPASEGEEVLDQEEAF